MADATTTKDRGLVKIDSTFGSALLDESHKSRMAGIQKAVVSEVQAMLDARVREEELLAMSTRNIDILKRKIAAIDAGLFSLDDYHTIVFTEEELNTNGVITESCKACGAPVNRLPGGPKRRQ